MDTPHVAGLHLSFLDSDACQKPFPDTSQQNVHWLCYYCNKCPAFGVTVVAKGVVRHSSREYATQATACFYHWALANRYDSAA